jgi:hypothetical protein
MQVKECSEQSQSFPFSLLVSFVFSGRQMCEHHEVE